MDRFEYLPFKLAPDENLTIKELNVKLYDGDEKTNFEDGEIVVTTHRLYWAKPGEIAKGNVVLSLHLKYVTAIDKELASSFVFGKKFRIILRLLQPGADKGPGPYDRSSADFIKLSGRNGLQDKLFQVILMHSETKAWLQPVNQTFNSEKDLPRRIVLRTGIVGIERNLVEKQKQTDENINLAFQDLNKLIGMAKDMVGISQVISNKIRDRQGDISEDETVRFKSYLMSMGIDDPVTRDNFTDNSEYFQSLSRQICEMLLEPIIECGGMMSMADVYCRVNRARGLELLSPEDLLNACKLLNGPIKMRKFPSGSVILQLENHDDEAVAKDTTERVETANSLTIEELATALGISIILAQERLLTAERAGGICRDESIEGLRFYSNLFLTNKI